MPPPEYNSAFLNALMRPARVCVCRNVSEAQIREAVSEGDRTFAEVQARTRCSTGCGTCERKVRDIIANAVSTAGADPAAASAPAEKTERMP